MITEQEEKQMDKERMVKWCERELKRAEHNADSFEDMENRLNKMYEKYGVDVVLTARERTGI